MKRTNKYGYIHGGCSFFHLDTKTHELAIKEIGECMTSNASIYYHKPLLKEDVDDLDFNLEIISKSKSTILIQAQILKEGEKYVTGMFTFVKIKK